VPLVRTMAETLRSTQAPGGIAPAAVDPGPGRARADDVGITLGERSINRRAVGQVHPHRRVGVNVPRCARHGIAALARSANEMRTDQPSRAHHQHAARSGHYRSFSDQSYGMNDLCGSIRSISVGSCGIDAQLATSVGVLPRPLKPFHTPGGTFTSW